MGHNAMPIMKEVQDIRFSLPYIPFDVEGIIFRDLIIVSCDPAASLTSHSPIKGGKAHNRLLTAVQR
jgi:hypothetical protein